MMQPWDYTVLNPRNPEKLRGATSYQGYLEKEYEGQSYQFYYEIHVPEALKDGGEDPLPAAIWFPGFIARVEGTSAIRGLAAHAAASKVIVGIDWMGHGYSTGVPNTIYMKMRLEILSDLIEGIENLVIGNSLKLKVDSCIGHSLSGPTLCLWRALNPDKALKVIAIGPAFEFNEKLVKKLNSEALVKLPYWLLRSLNNALRKNLPPYLLMDSGVVPSDLVVDPKMKVALCADFHRTNRTCQLREALELLTAQKWLGSLHEELRSSNAGIYIHMGEEDLLVTPNPSTFECFMPENITRYPNAGHEIFNEGDVIYNKLLDNLIQNLD